MPPEMVSGKRQEDLEVSRFTCSLLKTTEWNSTYIEILHLWYKSFHSDVFKKSDVTPTVCLIPLYRVLIPLEFIVDKLVSTVKSKWSKDPIKGPDTETSVCCAFVAHPRVYCVLCTVNAFDPDSFCPFYFF